MKIVLKGGTHDGEIVNRYRWQRKLYIPKKLSEQEFNELQIDDCLRWRAPDEVYVKDANENFNYSHTVHYKPEE